MATPRPKASISNGEKRQIFKKSFTYILIRRKIIAIHIVAHTPSMILSVVEYSI